MSRSLEVLAVSASGIMSGAERVLFDYALSGRDRGERWTLAIPPGRFRDVVDEAGIDWIDLPVLHVGQGGTIERIVRSLLGSVRAARSIRAASADADVIVVNSVRALPAMWMAHSRTPVAWLIHDVIEREGIRRMVRLVKSGVDLAIGVSEASVSFAKASGIRSTVVANGTQWPVEPATSSAESGPPIIGITAALTPWKGHRVFLEAAAMTTGDARFEVLGGAPFEGDEDYAASLIAQAEASPIAERIEFLGQRTDPRAVMRRWSIAVSASIEPEAGPLAVLEAMSLGLAVVVTDHGGGPELVADTGLVVPPGDAAAMSAAFQSLLDDPERRSDLGQRGRARIGEHFTLDDAATAFGATLRELSASGS